VLADLFANRSLRGANVANQREEIAQVVYNARQATQYSPVTGSPEYDLDGAALAKYDPTRANDLLDQLGLKRGADGTRYSDGNPSR